MKKLTFIILFMSLSACHKNHSGGLMTTDPKNISVAIAGQSNAYWFTPAGEEGFKAEWNTFYPGSIVTFFNCAVGGTAITEWTPDRDHFQDCVTIAKSRNLHFDLLFFYQGEADARLGTDNWCYWFSMVMTGFREWWGKSLPIVYAQIATTTDPVYQAHWDSIKAQQPQAEQSMPTILMVKTDDQPLKDSIHLTDAGEYIIGQRVARLGKTLLIKGD